jgi:hypothetical protein
MRQRNVQIETERGIHVPHVWSGDANETMDDEDKYDGAHKAHNANYPSCHIQERQAFELLMKEGDLYDILKKAYSRVQTRPPFTFFWNQNYKRKNKGMRLDVSLGRYLYHPKNAPFIEEEEKNKTFIIHARTSTSLYDSDHRANLISVHMPSFTSLKAKEEMQRTFDSVPKSSTTTVLSSQDLDKLSMKIEEINLIERTIWRNNPKINIA